MNIHSSIQSTEGIQIDYGQSLALSEQLLWSGGYDQVYNIES